MSSKEYSNCCPATGVPSGQYFLPEITWPSLSYSYTHRAVAAFVTLVRRLAALYAYECELTVFAPATLWICFKRSRLSHDFVVVIRVVVFSLNVIVSISEEFAT